MEILTHLIAFIVGFAIGIGLCVHMLLKEYDRQAEIESEMEAFYD